MSEGDGGPREGDLRSLHVSDDGLGPIFTGEQQQFVVMDFTPKPPLLVMPNGGGEVVVQAGREVPLCTLRHIDGRWTADYRQEDLDGAARAFLDAVSMLGQTAPPGDRLRERVAELEAEKDEWRQRWNEWRDAAIAARARVAELEHELRRALDGPEAPSEPAVRLEAQIEGPSRVGSSPSSSPLDHPNLSDPAAWIDAVRDAANGESGRCTQCGQPWEASACGPSHAVIADYRRRRAASDDSTGTANTGSTE